MSGSLSEPHSEPATAGSLVSGPPKNDGTTLAPERTEGAHSPTNSNGARTNDIKERISGAWGTGDVAEVCGLLVDHVMPRCIRWLLSKYGQGGLSYEDAEDCFNHGIEKLLERADCPDKVTDPYNYIWTCAKNEAVDILRENSRAVPLDPEWLAEDGGGSSGQDVGAIDPERWLRQEPSVLAEAALDAEIDARQDQIRDMLRLALAQMTDGRQRIIQLLLEHGPSRPSQLLAELLGQTEGTVRSLKKRAFDDLRRLLPWAAEQLRLDFAQVLRQEPEVEVAREPSLPSPEEDENP